MRWSRKWEIVMLSCLLLALTGAADFDVVNFLPTFAVLSPQHMSKVDAAFAFSLFVAVGNTCLLVCTCITSRISAGKALVSAYVCIIGANLLLLYSSFKSEQLVWLSAGALGVGVAPAQPCVFSFVATQVTPTTRIFALFTLAISVGRAFASFLTGSLIEDDPLVFIKSNVAYALSCNLIVSLILKRNST